MESANGRISESRSTNYASRVTHHVKRDNIPTFQRANATRNPKSKIANPKSVVVEVSDTGIGIPEGEQAHIFERFYQTAGGSSAGGTGLGLAIVKELVDLHGGTVSVESAPGEGCTFVVCWPADQRDRGPNEGEDGE